MNPCLEWFDLGFDGFNAIVLVSLNGPAGKLDDDSDHESDCDIGTGMHATGLFRFGLHRNRRPRNELKFKDRSEIVDSVDIVEVCPHEGHGAIRLQYA